MTCEFGILLLHFGGTANRESVIEQAPQLEEWGFGSVWTRDHLEFQPHEFEPKGTAFMEPFTTLTSIATLTESLKVGTATTIPFRHPLVTSQLYGGLAAVAGADRIIAGIGAGTPRKPFDATGIPFEDRFKAVKEMAEILKLTWAGGRASYQGELYQFTDVTIDPHPSSDTPIWYGGSSPASVRRALEYCDGWFPGRCPMKTFEKRLRPLRRGAEEQGRRMGVGIIPCISIGRSREDALGRVNVTALLAEARSRDLWVGPFDSADDLHGMLIAGSPSDCIDQIGQFIRLGVDQLVFDFRLRPDEYPQQVAWLAKDILPAVREMARTGSERQGAEA